MKLSVFGQSIHRRLEMIDSIRDQINVGALIRADRRTGPLGNAVEKACGSGDQGLKFVKQGLVAVVESLVP
jgi:hypothetical protein